MTPPSPSSDAPFRVLVVDDEAHDAEIVRELLPEAVEFATAGSLREALAALSSGPAPDCILLDLWLPDADGVDAVAAIASRYPAVAVVVVTAHDADELTLGAVAHGAYTVLVKGSFDRPTLLRTMLMARDRKRVEWRVFRGDERYRRILNTAAVGVWSGDRSGETVYANCRFESMLALDPGALDGESLLTVVADDDRDHLRHALATVGTSGAPLAVTFRSASGTSVPALVTLRIVPGGRGDDHTLVAFIAETNTQSGAFDAPF